jgi:hypothetical protein
MNQSAANKIRTPAQLDAFLDNRYRHIPGSQQKSKTVPVHAFTQ